MAHEEVNPTQTAAFLLVVESMIPVAFVSLPVGRACPFLICSGGQKLVLRLANLLFQAAVYGVDDVNYSDEGSIV